VDSFLVKVFRLSKNGSIRVNTYDLDVGIEFLQSSRDTCDLAACSSTYDTVIELASALIENFLSCLVVMSQWVRRILILIEDMSSRKSLLELQSNTNVRTDMIERHLSRSSNDGGAKGGKNI